MRRALFALLFLACSAEQPATTTTVAEKPKAAPPPTAQQARELIANAPDFGEFEFTDAAYSLPMERSIRNEPAEAAAKALAKAGWIAVDGSGKVVLTGKSKSDKRFLVRPNGILDIVPLAKKELGEVTAVRMNDDGTAAADFTWTWVPNEVGRTFAERYAGTQQATATLIHDGTSWSILGIKRGA